VTVLTAQLERLRRTKAGRAWARYSAVRGNVLAGGVAYFAFFSLFPALAIAFTVTGYAVGDRPDLQKDIADYVNRTFGGATIIGRTPNTGLVSMDTLVAGDVLTLSALAGLLTLLLTGLGWIGALRDGVSAVFGRPGAANPLTAKLGDVAVLASIGTAALASMAASLTVSGATDVTLDRLGLHRSALVGAAVSVLTSLIVLVIDTVLFLVLFQLLPGVRLPVDDLYPGALAGGVALGLLKLLGGLLLRFLTGNPFFAAFVLVAALLVWMNLAARAGLVAAAWAATTAEERGHLPPLLVAAAPTALTVAPPVEEPAVPAYAVPDYSTRTGDRTALAAGAVFGLTVAVGARVVGRAGSSLRDTLRRPPADD